MNNGLANIQDVDLGLRQQAGNSRRQTRAIRAGNIDQDYFLQGNLVRQAKNRILTGIGNDLTDEPFFRAVVIAILAVQAASGKFLPTLSQFRVLF